MSFEKQTKTENAEDGLDSTGREKESIRIAATSDLHGQLDGILDFCNEHRPDVLAIAGDIEPLGCQDTAMWFEDKFFSLVRDLGCEVVATPGNHDFHLSRASRERGGFPDNFHLLVDEEFEYRGFRFYGTPWVPYISGRWCFERISEDVLANDFAKIPSGLDVLISHSPPYVPGGFVDVSLDRDRARHFGSTSLSYAIEEKRPRLVLCGHIHSGAHTRTEFSMNPYYDGESETSVFNVSRLDETYVIEYGIRALSINRGGVVSPV